MNPITPIRARGRKTAADVKPKANLNNEKLPSFSALKQKYLQCFGARIQNASVLRDVVRDLIDEGVPRQTLAEWAVDAGYAKGYVSSLLSRILVFLGLRERKQGAGRKPSPAALELLAHARDQYGENCLKVLRAAWRAGNAQRAVTNAHNETRASRLIVAPQLQTLEFNSRPAIRRGIRPAGRHNGSRYHPTVIHFKRKSGPASAVN
jgi:hypothetical protein